MALPVENTILVTASNDTDVQGGAEMSIEGETKLNETLVEKSLLHVFTLLLNCKTHVSNIHKPQYISLHIMLKLFTVRDNYIQHMLGFPILFIASSVTVSIVIYVYM